MPYDIPPSELSWRFGTSGGPGGQHANRSNTRVELTFDVERSRVFDESTRTRIIDRIGSTVRIVEDRSRSQTMNRRRALERLHERLERAAAPQAPRRRRTKPSAAARERRLRMKRLRGEQKRKRRRPTTDE